MRILSRLCICFSFFLLNTQAVIPIPDVATAMVVAQGIANSPASGRTKFDYLVDDIERDHAENSFHPFVRRHEPDDSFFRTFERNKLEEIIRYILDYADDYDIEHNRFRGETFLILKKTFSHHRSNSLIGKTI